jgi:hypothetical protein
MHLNAALMVVDQLGIGPEGGIHVVDSSTTWDELVDPDTNIYNAVKTYVFLRVRILFDPPTTSFTISAVENQLKELEWRLSTNRESVRWVSPTAEQAFVSSSVAERVSELSDEAQATEATIQRRLLADGWG